MILFPSTKRKRTVQPPSTNKNRRSKSQFSGSKNAPQQKTSVSPEVEIDHFQGGRFPNVADALGCHCVCAGGNRFWILGWDFYEGYTRNTPPKTKMEPENEPLDMKKHDF